MPSTVLAPRAPSTSDPVAQVDHASGHAFRTEELQKLITSASSHNTLPTRSAADDPDDLCRKPGLGSDSSILRFGPLTIPAGKGVKLVQPSVAAEFAAKYKVAYREEDQEFYRYHAEDGVWSLLKSGPATILICEFMKELSVRCKETALLCHATSSFARSILALVKGIAPLEEPSHRALIPVRNGVLDLSGETPCLRAYTPEDGFRSKLEVSYDPGAKCERFLSELIGPALPDPDDISLLQRDLGRQLLPGNEAQTLSLITGEGGSGKSVLVSIMERIIGLGNVAQMRSDKLNGRFETHGYHGKSTLVGKDVRPDYLSNDGSSVIKALTGADRIDTERKYGGKHAICGCFYLVITSNGRLRVNLQDDRKAWSRRLICYTFSRETPAARIPCFDELLMKEEGSGILNWFVSGLYAHRKELQEHGGFVLTTAQKQRVDDLLMESDSERGFLENHLVKGGGTVSVQEIWDAYSSFVQSRKWRIPSKQVFLTRLPDLMLELYGVERDNHVMRNGSLVRGFKRVMLKSHFCDAFAVADSSAMAPEMAA